MLVQGARQRAAFVERDTAGSDTEVTETLAADSKRERVFKRLEAGQEAIRLDHDARTRRRGAGLLEGADELLHIDRAAFIQAPDAHVRIDHHHRLNVGWQALEEPADGARLATVDAVVKTTPARQPQ